MERSYQCYSLSILLWLFNLPPNVPPPRNKALIAGLIKGNQWVGWLAVMTGFLPNLRLLQTKGGTYMRRKLLRSIYVCIHTKISGSIFWPDSRIIDFRQERGCRSSEALATCNKTIGDVPSIISCHVASVPQKIVPNKDVLSRELTYPTWGKGKSSSKVPW